MTLLTMLMYIGIVALVLTFAIGFLKKGHKNWIMTFLQNFCGVLFLFSGWVKAVDPLGTAYKMEQYFTEFNTLFDSTWFSFISPIFPLLSEYSIGFSVFMIIFEIILGLMLILGMRKLFTSWLFLGLVIFFTILTGFTFLTGFVPEGANFFHFGSWAAYDENNMKVTDCGCFGDFIKLKPRVSFMKDIFLLIPAIYFVIRHKNMHQLFNKNTRTAIVTLSTVALFVYCLSNYKWDLPHTDFRPFKIGADIAGQKALEMEAAANVQIIGWKLKSKSDPSKIVELSNDVYMKEYAKYPKTEWEVFDQIKTQPIIEQTKLSDFEISSLDGYDVAEDLLGEEEYSLWIVCDKLKGKAELQKVMVSDTTFIKDTIELNGLIVIQDSIGDISQREMEKYVMKWDEAYMKKFDEGVNTFISNAKQDGVNAHIFVGKYGKDEIEDFAKSGGPEGTYYMADDILLKTIVRSNPGVVLVKSGKIIHKWHLKKLPKYEEVKSSFGI